MCGIAGLVIQSPPAGFDARAAVGQMILPLAHRGPDGQGLWSDGVATLGHRRLAIIDLETGDQPMVGASGIVAVLNGEIYNYVELRDELRARGAIFRTNSDTEVLIRAYEEYGEECLTRFVGMYAFAIWDPHHRHLFLARDRLGKKPLFYYQSDHLFAFASEIKALLRVSRITEEAATIDPLAISDFLSLGYILAPKTVFRGIRRLPPGYCATLHAGTKRFAVRNYWHLEDRINARSRITGRAARERFAELLDDAVRIRLRSDVPIGIYLSGGIDSSAVAATVASLSARPPSAFCVGFDEDSFDESRHAQTAADHLGINLKIVRNAPGSAETLGTLIWHVDEPFADTSIVPTYLLNRAARPHLVVALTGDGSDEVLAGYRTYTADRVFAAYRHVPFILRQAVAALARLALRPSYRKVSWDYMARQFLAAPSDNREQAHYWWRVIYSDMEKNRLMSPELNAACRGYDPFDEFHQLFGRVRHGSFLAQSQYVDVKTWLEADILVKVDRMSMANGVEVRAPFLDHRLVEFCSELADSEKISGLGQKVILKDVMGARLPAQIIHRSKRGFNAPLAKGSALAIEDAAQTGLFNHGAQLDPRREDITFKSFSLTALNAWLKLYAGLRRSGTWQKATGV